MVIASVGRAGEVQKEKYVCGICGFAITELEACPRCKMQNEETTKGLRRRQQRDGYTAGLLRMCGSTLWLPMPTFTSLRELYTTDRLLPAESFADLRSRLIPLSPFAPSRGVVM